MSPGGHLVTTALACGALGATTGSAALVAGVAVGGFLIDVDHAVDYVLFDGQRDLRPAKFLRYYLESRARYLVLVLHSYELFALLGALAWWFEAPALVGYLLGGLMHLGLDIAFNGKLTPRNIWAFYSFTHRARHGFSAPALLGETTRTSTSQRFWVDFFRGGALPSSVTGRAKAGESSWPKSSRSSEMSSTTH